MNAHRPSLGDALAMLFGAPLPPLATLDPATIKAAYRRRARLLHPDSAAPSANPQAFCDLRQAYLTLLCAVTQTQKGRGDAVHTTSPQMQAQIMAHRMRPRLGDLAVQQRWLHPTTLAYLLRLQAQRTPRQRLGDLALGQGKLSSAQIARLLALQEALTPAPTQVAAWMGIV